MQKLLALETSEPLYFLLRDIGVKSLEVRKGKQSHVAVRFDITVLSSVSHRAAFHHETRGTAQTLPLLCWFRKSCYSRSPWFLWSNPSWRFSVWEADAKGQHLLHALGLREGWAQGTSWRTCSCAELPHSPCWTQALREHRDTRLAAR